jgi:DNA invertase Pin-like site-specific DNA recombinase
MRIGYARVSTPDQSLAIQLEALQQSGCPKIFQEVAGGAQAERQALSAALDYMRPGDTLVVWRLDRLGRSLGQLIVLMNTLHKQPIGFQSVVEAIDTTTAMGQFFFQITGAFAELERHLMRERTLAGLASAAATGQERRAAQNHRFQDVCDGAPALRGPHELRAAYLRAPRHCTAYILS